MKKNIQTVFLVIFIIAFIIVWHFLSLGRKTLIFPSPYEVFVSLYSIISSPSFLPTVFNTVRAVFLSFAAAFIPALILGIISKLVPFIHRLMEFVSGFIRSVPTVAIILMALLLLPVSYTPVIICYFVVFPVLYTNISEGLQNVDVKLIEMARIYKFSNAKIIHNIYVPSLKTYIIAGARSALGLNFKVMVTAEVFNFVNHRTIGAQMYMHKIQIDLAGIMAWALIVVAVSIIFDLLIKILFRENTQND
ncbi:MAG: ABC transporter permease subunit [Clostridiaceae bacterium]|nr:ABC transporter permease subunit [Clostridiaceae bacterium]